MSSVFSQRRAILRALTLFSPWTWTVTRASAQDSTWPRQPIKLVVNFAPGSSPDVCARAISGALQQSLGQPVLVENRAGASGLLGADAVAKAAPDGHTWLASAGSTIAIEPLLNAKLPFDPERDLVPVAALARIHLFLLVRSESPWRTFADLLKAVKSNPGKLTYGSPGTGTGPHIAGEMLKSMTHTFVVHVPYRGSSPALQDLLGGHLDYVFDPGIGLQQVQSGRLRLLAVASPSRVAAFPDTPTLSELGLPGFDAGTTHGLYAPRGTPAAVVARMNAEVNRALVTAPVKSAIEALGAEVVPMSPGQLAAVSRADRERYEVVVRERRITKDG